MREALTIYDACYVVLARRLDATFVTADASLARAITDLQVDIVLGGLA